jgi:DNA-directed RNA polymerase subunit RPC12/RpoP
MSTSTYYPMPRLEIEYVCKKCGKTYPAAINFSGRIEDIELDDNQSRCPFCGEWNCAGPAAVEEASKALREGQ